MQVTEVERRLETTLETVQERVVFLELLHGQWSQFNADLSALKEWTRQTAPAMVRALQSDQVGPQERLARAQALQVALCEKAQVLKALDDQAHDLVKGKLIMKLVYKELQDNL